MFVVDPTLNPIFGDSDPVTLSQLADAITRYVQDDSELKGGYFLVYDDVNDEVLALRLVKVHEERLSSLGDDTYFCCADFATPGGMVYDLDVFMQGESAAELVPTQITVHKEDGEARYTWYEEGGVWKMKSV